MAENSKQSSRVILDASNVLEALGSDEFAGDQEFIINISQSELEKIAEDVILANPELKALAEKNKEELQKWSEQIDARDALYEQRAKLLADLEKELELLRIEYAAAYKSHAQTLKNRRSQSSQAQKRSSNDASNDADDDDVIVLDTKPSNTVLTKQLVSGQELYVGCGDVWKKGSLVEVVSLKEDKYQYRIRMGKTIPKLYPKSKIAFPNMPARSVRLGTRIIAKYFEGEDEFYPGIVAEPPYDGNKFRYLIFFDDGSALYQSKENIRVVVEQRESQWEAMPTVLQDFIKHYIETYNRRRILRLTVGQQVKTEREGHWMMAECMKVDCSLVQMKFPGRTEPHNTEWIYRGSTRFLPLYKDHESLNKERSVTKQKTTMRASGAGSRKAAITHHNTYNYKPPQPMQRVGLQNIQQRIEAMKVKRDEHAGLRVRVNHPTMTNIMYKPHICTPLCIHMIRNVDLGIYKGKYMLTTPIYMGFQRHITRTRRTKYVYHSSKKLIYYKAPCGRGLRNIQEVGQYLEATNCQLTIDMFSFEQALHLFEPFQASNVLVTINDISDGKENVPISCINALTHDLPDPLNYSGVRMPQKDVKLNTDPEFMICCDCTDNCADKTKCACQQLTFEGYQILQPDIPLEKAGYNYRRLTENIVTGIYECNSKCKCKKTCFNRVVQNHLQQRLQIFKTEQRGWGIRCLDDIPLGSFICIYAGQLLSEEGADQGGRAYGDEYFAEIDFIEVGCDVKQSYEDGVVEEESDENKSDSEWEKSSDSDGEGFVGQRSDIKPMRSKKNKPTDKEINDTPDKHNESDDKGEQTMMRSYFNESSPYVMDAKTSGNLGRYLNHSCNPNVFVQTVFVDTHDPRFPWISFFAKTFVRAGSELTWDYGYQPGLVEGKVMYCHCKSSNCRGRLL